MDDEKVRSPEEIMAMLETGDPFLKEIAELGSMTPEQRFKYAVSTIMWLDQSICWVLGADGKIQLAKRADILQKTLKDEKKVRELTICALWTVKPQYRPVWMKLIGDLVNMGDKNSKGAGGKKGS